VGSAFDEVLSVPPGITGLSQLAFTRESEVLDREPDRVEAYLRKLLPQKLAIDLLYVQDRSLRLDLRIILWTFVSVALRRDVAVHRTTGRLSLREPRQLAPQNLTERATAA
jgi:lipopolysaccharide/colanic/teichoic acid biosynthesis glycosyltransferase